MSLKCGQSECAGVAAITGPRLRRISVTASPADARGSTSRQFARSKKAFPAILARRNTPLIVVRQGPWCQRGRGRSHTFDLETAFWPTLLLAQTVRKARFWAGETGHQAESTNKR